MSKYNVEIKARSINLDRAREVLRSLGARPSGRFSQTDVYFRVAEGRLKLRKDGRGIVQIIYYRRPNALSPRLSQYDMAYLPRHLAEELERLLAMALGVDAVVNKIREVYTMANVKINLDEVEGCGTFIEIEAAATDPGEGTALVEVVNNLGESLAIRPEDLVAESYADLTRAAE